MTDATILKIYDAADYNWFAARPGRAYRLRKARRSEPDWSPTRNVWVAVHNDAPHHYECCAFEAGKRGTLDNSESFAHAMFETLKGGPYSDPQQFSDRVDVLWDRYRELN